MSTPVEAVDIESKTSSDAANSQDEFLIQDALRRFRRAPLVLSVELGSGKLRIRDLLVLRHHSLIELKRPAGSLLDMTVNGVLLGKGEPVVHEGRVGVQIHEILESEE